ncbi:MAG: flagellar biosynthetic protein FliQ [Deltaproteobacteria bacterium]|nr:flagellar biosynthetic protein FliQ [Deltaproteobacteria bacterium]
MDALSLVPHEQSVGAYLACAMFGAALLSAVPLAAAVVAGFVMGVIQTATQLQDPSLAFIPKVVATSSAILLFLPGGLELLADFFASAIHAAISGGALDPR